MDLPRVFVIELSASWNRWAKKRSAEELQQINSRLHQREDGFGKPHLHAGLGVRRSSPRIFEFRTSRDLRVVFLLIKPNTFRLLM